MATFEIILLVAAAVLLSAVIDQALSKVYPPLIQIGLGVLISLFATGSIDILLDPDFFLLLFIAPLLFHDAKKADKLGLWRNRRSIVSLAIGLVVAITLIIGFWTHLLIPSIPLTAAFALGAALGPTDVVAVTSLKSAARLSNKENSLLSGEALINDASGVVSFQFAIAATVTGAFSLAQATVSFLISFFGGIAVGIVLALLARFITRKAQESGLDSITFHVLFDVMLPFIIFLVAEIFSASGVLAVVAAGLILSSPRSRVIGPSASRLNIVSSSVWSVLTFALNGIVFVMLGMQLPNAVRYTWASASINNAMLVVYVLAITVVLVAVRFVWVFVMERISQRNQRRRYGQHSTFKGMSKAQSALSSLVLTIGGPKGAVTLSIIFSIPFLIDSGEAFPQRQLIIFLASGVILLTLLLANFLLPVLSPAPKEERRETEGAAFAETQVEILKRVISQLISSRTKENTQATRVVVHAYNQRIGRIRTANDITDPSTVRLRIDVMRYQQDVLLEKVKEGSIDELSGVRYIRRLARAQNLIRHRHRYKWIIRNVYGNFGLTLKVLWLSFKTSCMRAVGIPVEDFFNDVSMLAEQCAIDYLEYLQTLDEVPYPRDAIEEQLMIHLASLHASETARLDINQLASTNKVVSEVERHAYQIELEEIQEALERDEISRSQAKHMRDNVYLMLVDLDNHRA